MPTPWSNGSACKSSEPNEKSEPLERTAQLGMNVTSPLRARGGSARPDLGGAVRSFGHGLQVGL